MRPVRQSYLLDPECSHIPKWEADRLEYRRNIFMTSTRFLSLIYRKIYSSYEEVLRDFFLRCPWDSYVTDISI